MNEDILKTVIDATGTELMPADPESCLGNGERGFECCCDECDFLMLCFPNFDPERKQENTDAGHHNVCDANL